MLWDSSMVRVSNGVERNFPGVRWRYAEPEIARDRYCRRRNEIGTNGEIC